MVEVRPSVGDVRWVVAASMAEGQHYGNLSWVVFGIDDDHSPASATSLNGLTFDASGWPGPGTASYSKLSNRQIPRAEACLGVGEGPSGPTTVSTIKVG